ncbi:MAG: PAS domain-containing sensor histidine kinase [Kineosporiaceae bacterium]
MVEVALLDRSGVIVEVDRGWRDYCRAHGGDLRRCGPGASYLDICDAAEDDEAARSVATAIRTALRGDLPAVRRVRVACPGPEVTEWFDILVTSRFDDAGGFLGVAVIIVPVAPGVAVGGADNTKATASPDHLPLDLVDLLDALDYRIVVLDAASLRRVYVNRAVLDRTGYTATQLASLPVGATVVPDDTARFQEAVRSVVDGLLREVSVDVRERSRNGAAVPVEARFMHRPSPDGGPGYVVIVSRDLRERSAAEERLRISEESFRAAFEQAPIGMAIRTLHPDGRRVIARANAAMGEILGVPAAALAGRDMTEFTDPGDEAQDRATARRMLDGTQRSVFARRKRYRRADGSRVWVEMSAFLVDFPAVAGVTTLAVVVDVTRTRELEIERTRRAALAALAADIAATVLAGGSSDDVHAEVVRAVPAAFDAVGCALLLLGPDSRGVTVSAAHGRAGWCGRGPSRAQAEALQSIQSTTTFARRTLTPGPALVVRFPHDGDEGLLLVTRSPDADDFSAGDLELLSGLGHRIGVAVELGMAQQGQAQLARLEERQRIARDLHDTVIQDLIAIGMQIDAAEQVAPGEDDPRAREIVEQLETVVRRLRESVFAFSGPRSGSDVRTSLVESISDASRVLGHVPTLQISGPLDEAPAIVGAELHAVLREALSNVARHAHATATWVRVAVDDGSLTLTVEDDGVGIAPGAERGTGLVDIRERARDLGGDSDVEDREGGGTRLRWTVPLRPARRPRRRERSADPGPRHEGLPRT